MKDRRCDTRGEFVADGALSRNGPFISMKHSDKSRTFSTACGLQTPVSFRFVGRRRALTARQREPKLSTNQR